jgi:hypothetical protein
MTNHTNLFHRILKSLRRPLAVSAGHRCARPTRSAAPDDRPVLVRARRHRLGCNLGGPGAEVRFSDDDDVADLVAERCFLRNHPGERWSELSARTRRRLRNRAKSWLSTDALDRMTVARFDERDPAGEIRGWLRQIAELAGISP